MPWRSGPGKIQAAATRPHKVGPQDPVDDAIYGAASDFEKMHGLVPWTSPFRQPAGSSTRPTTMKTRDLKSSVRPISAASADPYRSRAPRLRPRHRRSSETWRQWPERSPCSSRSRPRRLEGSACLHGFAAVVQSALHHLRRPSSLPIQLRLATKAEKLHSDACEPGYPGNVGLIARPCDLTAMRATGVA